MIDQIRIDGILQVASPVVGQEDVDGLGAGVVAVAGAGDGVVDGVDDVGVRGEEGVGFDLLEGERDGFLAEGAADLLQGVEGAGLGVEDEVDVGEAALDCPRESVF